MVKEKRIYAKSYTLFLFHSISLFFKTFVFLSFFLLEVMPSYIKKHNLKIRICEVCPDYYLKYIAKFENIQYFPVKETKEEM